MLDIKFIRDNADMVAENAKKKGYEWSAEEFLKLDRKWLDLLKQREEFSRERNELIKETKHLPGAEQIERGKDLREKEKKIIAELDEVEEPYRQLVKEAPNIAWGDVPDGKSEADNVFGPTKGTIPKFEFQPKTHWQIGENRGFIDKERAAKVVGSRFAYIKGDLVKLQLAIIQFTIDQLTDEKVLKEIASKNELKVSTKAFTPILPPFMLRTEVFDAMDRLDPREERYKVGSDEDDLWLEGSAEHTLGPMHMGELLPIEELPLRYLGYATSFRREAGSYGKDTEGIIRMHQFDKLEMESFVNPEGGLFEHLFFVAIQEYLMQELGLPYRIVQKCKADIGRPNARGIDIEAWLPGHEKFMETHTADFMTDYQARSLGIKTKRIPPKGVVFTYDYNNPPTNFVHTNDATAFAMGRTMVAIIENYQTKDGKVAIPKALQPYMGGQTEI